MIGKRIQQLRLQKRLSLSELADRAGIAKSYLSSIERDIHGNPSIQVLEKVCHALDTDVPTLLSSASDSETAQNRESQPLDEGWLRLVHEAMESGISKEQFRELLEFQRWRAQHTDE